MRSCVCVRVYVCGGWGVACVRGGDGACMSACLRVCVCVCVGGGGGAKGGRDYRRTFV